MTRLPAICFGLATMVRLGSVPMFGSPIHALPKVAG